MVPPSSTITDEALAEAINNKEHRGLNQIVIRQLIREYVPVHLWCLRYDKVQGGEDHRNIPHARRHEFLQYLDSFC